MSDPDKERGTRSLIAEAEVLRGDKQGKGKQATRGLVRDAEKLIGREPTGRGLSPGAVTGVMIVILAIAIGVYMWLRS